MNPHAWKDKRVLVTGHTGFKGTWLCAVLRTLGAKVGGYALAPDPETQTLYPASSLDAEIASTLGDLSDLARLESCLKEFQPQFVFHLAAQSLVRASYSDPLATFRTNVMGTANLLECCRRCADLQGVSDASDGATVESDRSGVVRTIKLRLEYPVKTVPDPDYLPALG